MVIPFDDQKFRGHMTLSTPPFTAFWDSGVGGGQVTSFELWTVIIGSETTPAKCFNTPIQNALCRCQFRVKRGKNRGYPYWIFTPNERDLFQVPDVCAKFHQNPSKTATLRARTHTKVKTLSPPFTTLFGHRTPDSGVTEQWTRQMVFCPMLLCVPLRSIG